MEASDDVAPRHSISSFDAVVHRFGGGTDLRSGHAIKGKRPLKAPEEKFGGS